MGTLWKRRKERVIKTWHAPPHRPKPICSVLPTPIPCDELETWAVSPPFWLPPGMERPLRRLRALPPQQLPRIPRPVNPTGSQSRPPTPPHLCFPSQDGGSEQRSQFLLPLCVPPLPAPRVEAAKKMTCHAGGGGGGGGGAGA